MMKRTPPKGSNDSGSHYNSDPNLTSADSERVSDRVAQRQKRKHGHDQSDFKSLHSEIMAAIAILRNEQSEKFGAMHKNLELIKAQNLELQSTVEFLSNKYDDVMGRIVQLENEKKSTLGYIRSLEDRVDDLERAARSSSLEIRNVPAKPGETKEDLVDIIKAIGVCVGKEIQVTELKDVFRTNFNRYPRNTGLITVEFTSTITKNVLLASVKKFNRDHKMNRLNSSHVKMNGNNPIFVSDSLTKKAKKLFYQAREFAKANNYAYHWTSHGNIYLRKKEGAPAKKILNESDFEGLQLEVV